MQKKANVFKIVISLVFVLACLASCGTVPKANSGSGASGADSAVSATAGVTALTAKKLYAFTGAKISNLYGRAFVYENEDGKRGIMGFNGSDTAAKLEYVRKDREFFVVSERYSKYESATEAADLNIFGLADDTGETLIAPSYACFRILNSRYIEAYKAKVRSGIGTQGEYIYKCQYFLTTSHDSEAPAYTYDKYIFDTFAGKFVPEDSMHFFPYAGSTDDKSFDDGSYVIRTTETDTVYGPDDKVLFTYNPNEYQVNNLKDGYYVAKKTVNGEDKYLLLDKTGAKVSAEFDDTFDICGETVALYANSKYSVYTFDGKAVCEKPVDRVYYDELSKDLLVLCDGNRYTFLNGEGKVLLNAAESDKLGVNVYAVNGLASKESKDENTDEAFYNFDKKDYTISAYIANSVGNLLVSVSDGDSRYDLIDATNGRMLCEGYSMYDASDPVDGCCYVAARRTEGGYDIYKIQNKIDAVKNSLEDDALISQMQLDKIYQTKEDLFDELESALTEAGLSAAVDRDNGEIAFDAAVVFAGDSSAISADGRKLLDAFVKAYSTVLSAEKYSGFISKTVVEGHTAPLASSTYESGLPLSKDRAEKVREYCRTADAALAETMEAVGYSNSMPIYNPDGSINQNASRRVTFKCVINNAFRSDS